VMMVEPLRRALEAAQEAAPERAKVVLMSPQGQRFTQAMALAESESKALILVCGRYEGLDERFVAQVCGYRVVRGGLCAQWGRITGNDGDGCHFSAHSGHIGQSSVGN
jgi:tRNA (guanine-N1)-methyltransferase